MSRVLGKEAQLTQENQSIDQRGDKMSKPLCFVLQLVGALMMLFHSGDKGILIFGILLLIMGGVGIRNRFKQEKKQSDDMRELIDLLKKQNQTK